MSKLEIIDDPKKGILFVLGFIATVPFIEASVKLLGGIMAPPQIALTRFMIHIFVLSIYIYLYIPKEDWIARPSWPLILRGILASLGTICVYAGLAVLPLVDAVAIFFLTPIIITSLRPPEDLVKAIHSYGGLVFHDVISTRHAQKAVEQGVDGLILVCAGAGGHAGALSPFALLRETREWYDGTILLSGSISDGHSVASAIAMGADLAYIGTRFIATEESEADDGYKKMLVESAAKDIVYTNYFSGVHGNYLSPSVEKAGMDPLALPEADKTKMNFNSGGNASAKVWKDIYGSGQGINAIKNSPKVSTLIDQMKAEFQQARSEFSAKSNNY